VIRTSSRLSAAALACTFLVAARADAQVPACPFRGAPGALSERESPLDSVTMRLGDGQAKLCYGRPSAGGVPKIGGDFPFGAPWQMGANEPTTLHLDFPARVGSVDVEPGSYSLYVIPEAGHWTVVVNGNPRRWGLPIDAEVRAADIGSFPLTPSPLAEYVDRLTFRFEARGADSGTLVYEWESTALLIPLSHR
jgi:hypothetical protein